MFDGRRARRRPHGRRRIRRDAVVVNADFAHAMTPLVPTRLAGAGPTRSSRGRNSPARRSCSISGLKAAIDELRTTRSTWPTTIDRQPRRDRSRPCRCPKTRRSTCRTPASPTRACAARVQHALRPVPVTHRQPATSTGRTSRRAPGRGAASNWRRLGLPRRRAAHPVREHASRRATGSDQWRSTGGRRSTWPLARPDAAPAAAQPLRGSGRRLSGRRRHASRQRPAGDLRVARITARLLLPGPRLPTSLRAPPRRATAAGDGPARRLMRRTVATGADVTRPEPRRRHRRRPGGLAAACTLAARGHAVAVREERLARRQGGRPRRGRLPLRHGADHPDAALRAARASSPRPGATWTNLLDLRRLDPQWRCFFDDGAVLDLPRTSAAMAARPRRVRAAAASAGLPRLHATVASGCTTSRDRFFFWHRSMALRDMIDMRRNFEPRHAARRAARCGMGRDGRRHVRRHVPDARVAQMLDHFTQYVGSSPDASPGRAVRHRPHADRRGHLVSAGRHRAPCRGAGHAGAANSASSCAPGVGIDRIARARRAASRRARRKRARQCRLAAVVSNMDPCARYRELLGGEPGQTLRARAASASRPAPASCCTSAWTGPTTIWRTTISSSRATRSGVRRHLPPRRAGRRPDLLRRRARRAPSRASRRRAARRCTSSSIRRTCGRTTTGRRCSRPTGRPSWTS